MFRKIFSLFFALLVMSIYASGQPVLTMQQAIRDAMANRKYIQAGKLDSTIQRLQTEALYKKYGPQVALEYTYQYNPILQSSVFPVGIFNPELPVDATETIQFGTTWSQAAGVTVTQPLFDASTSRKISESKLQEKISLAGQAQTEYELAYDVAKAYINIWLQQQQLQSATIDSLRTWESYRLQKEKFQSGRLLKSDLNKAIINHNNTRQKVRDALSQVIENKIYLLFLTGQSLVGNYDVTIDTSFFEHGLQTSMNKKPDTDAIPVVIQLRMQQQLSLLQQQSEKSKYLPTFAIKGFLGANQYSNNFKPFETNTWFGYSYVGLSAKLPLLTGDGRQSKQQQLQFQSDQYLKKSGDKTAQFIQESATASLEMERTEDQRKMLGQNLALSRESLSIIQDRVAQGVETASALNIEELELQRIANDYDNKNRQEWLYWLDFIKASGLLTQLWK